MYINTYTHISYRWEIDRSQASNERHVLSSRQGYGGGGGGGGGGGNSAVSNFDFDFDFDSIGGGVGP